MKRIFMLYFALSASTFMHTAFAHSKRNDSLLQATARFKKMRVAQISNLDMHDLTATEIVAFKSLAKEIFEQEIATADCFSQANKRKYEVMYQKIGELDASRNLFCRNALI